MVFIFFFSDSTFAAVAGDILASAGKFIDGKTAVIGTAFTVCHSRSVFQAVDFVNGQHGGFFVCCIAFPRNERGTESTHDTCNVRTDGFTISDFFKTSQDSIIVEGTTLNDDMTSKFGCVGYFDYLVQRIFDYRISKTGRNVGYFRPFFLCLFYF